MDLMKFKKMNVMRRFDDDVYITDDVDTLIMRSGKKTKVTIPTDVDGVPVRVIAPSAFNYSNVIKINIPYGVEAIK